MNKSEYSPNRFPGLLRKALVLTMAMTFFISETNGFDDLMNKPKAPIKALMIAGGCCHDYPNQNLILSEGISARAHVAWNMILAKNNERSHKLPIYDDPDWLSGYDVVVHNECYGGVNDAGWLEKIAQAHEESGIPALFVHCSAHSYRASPTDAWRILMGAKSTSHERHRPLAVENLIPNHPIMKTFPEVWNTPNGELYKIEKMWPNAIPLAQAYGVDTKKDHVCAWLNESGKARVFATTLGHHNETMSHPVYLDMVTRGLLWVTGKLDNNGNPLAGFESPQVKLKKDERLILAADYQKKRIALVSESGQKLWEQPIRSIHDLQLLPNGNILYQPNWTDIIEMTPEGHTVWKYDAAKSNGNEGKRIEVHAFQRLSNGLTMIAESGSRRIIEVDEHGKIHRQIKLKVDNPDAHRDTRMARKLANGNYLVAHEKDACIREYDLKGKVVWEYKTGKKTYGVNRLKNGNTIIGNGDGHNVLIVNPKGETVWSIQEKELEGIQLAWVTTVEELPNGNFLIGNCHAGPNNPQIIEVTPDKKVVWQFKNFELFGNALPCSRVIIP